AHRQPEWPEVSQQPSETPRQGSHSGASGERHRQELDTSSQPDTTTSNTLLMVPGPGPPQLQMSDHVSMPITHAITDR
ncbi:hypothetical protein PIB30_111313, partial [Stylosanthes scabra]|nr:hypothetical protein [Stylosanthes scabra]